MALVVTFDEYNTAGETLTADITDIAYGNSDAADLVPANNKIVAGENSFDKYNKADFTGMASESLTEITDTKVWKSAGNYKTLEVITYVGDDGGSAGLAFVTPTETGTGDSDIPTSEPGGRNLSLGNSTTGVLTEDGDSDYFRTQRQTDSTTEPGALNSLTISLSYVVS